MKTRGIRGGRTKSPANNNQTVSPIIPSLF